METRLKPVKDYPDYWISNTGRVFSMKFNKCIELKAQDQGYRLCVWLRKQGKRKYFPIHKLVILAFGAPQPENKRLVRHLDGTYTHNHISNLEWGDDKENAEDRERHKKEKLQPVEDDYSWA